MEMDKKIMQDIDLANAITAYLNDKNIFTLIRVLELLDPIEDVVLQPFNGERRTFDPFRRLEVIVDLSGLYHLMVEDASICRETSVCYIKYSNTDFTVYDSLIDDSIFIGSFDTNEQTKRFKELLFSIVQQHAMPPNESEG